jgi:hypothetical protein
MDAEQLPLIIQWIRAGRVADARQALRQRLQKEPADERAWLWLADTMPDKPQRIAVLEHALKSNPQSELLRRSLARLKIQQFAQASPVNELVGSGEDYRTLPMNGPGGGLPANEPDLASPILMQSASTPNPVGIVEAPPAPVRKPVPKSLSLPIIRESNLAPSPVVPSSQVKYFAERVKHNQLAHKYTWKAVAWFAVLVGVFILATWIIWQVIQ